MNEYISGEHMNINNTMKIVFSAIGIGIVISCVMVQQLSGLSRQVDHMAQIRYLSYQAADELRQSSDDLTRLGRTYVVTGDEKYEKMYLDIVAIRNGEKARPLGYHTIYWDLMLDYGDKPKQDGASISLQQRMKELGFTQKELDLLQESQNYSDTLVAMEVKAMNAVKGLFQDGSGNYTVRGNPDRDMAINLLHSQVYHKEKAKIMAPIEQFFVALEERTAQQLNTAAQKVRNTVLVGTFSLIGVFILAIIGYLVVNRKVVKPIGAIAGILQQVDKEANLALRVDANSHNELGMIGENINKILVSYAETISKINHVNHTMTSISQTIHSITGSTVSVADQQNLEMEMAATAMEEMTSALASVAESTNMAEEYAANTEQEASTSRKIFDKTMAEFYELEGEFAKTSDIIQELATESNNVGNVLDVIKAIAEQTNLLALNAAIEAARAGEQGRGFAVVADEVRSLAQRTQASTGEIETMITSLQEKAEQSTKTIRVSAEKMHSTRDNVGVANDALNTIQNSAIEIHKLNTSIATATEEQLTVSDEISSNLNTIQILSGDMKQTVHQLEPVVVELQQSVNELNSAIAHFRT